MSRDTKMSAPMLLSEMSKLRIPARLSRALVSASKQPEPIHRPLSRRGLYANSRTLNTKCCTSVPNILNNTHRLLSSASAERKCWNCGSELEKEKEKFFCNCGVVQYIPTDLTYFELMQCEESFEIDVERMSTLYKDLQRQYHPDKFSQKSKEEQNVAESQSSYINKAYMTLLKPMSRGLYLLELHGDPLEETNSAVDPEFLMEVMEINEDLAEAEGDIKAVEALEAINNKRISLCIRNISESFAEGNVAKAKNGLVKLKYFHNIEDKIKEIHRSRM